ncbi:MAG TPA: glycosyltransferase [Candidatus Acetothermia bacterium]|nr:glycosyltransferase [Candidatus Acetothermia bacterium]
MQRIRILNVDVDNVRQSDLLTNACGKRIIVPINVDVLMKFQQDAELYRLIQARRGDICICLDSQIIKAVAAIVLGKRFVEKISGSDLLPAFYRHYAHDYDMRIFLLGAMGGVARRAMERINHKVERNIVTDALSPSYGFENRPQECADIVGRINASGATMLVVGVGAPKQEKWIFRYADQLPNVRLFLAAGATIDFEAGNAPRAPVFISAWGFEWLYRLLHEPRRLAKRYLIDNVPFFWLAVKQRLGAYRDPFAAQEAS